MAALSYVVIQRALIALTCLRSFSAGSIEELSVYYCGRLRYEALLCAEARWDKKREL